MANKTLWIRFSPFDLAADRFWRLADCRLRGLYWSLISDLYLEGGKLTLDVQEIKRCCNWDDQKDGDFQNALKTLLDAKFQVSKNIIMHKRVTQELERSNAIRQQRSAIGSLGGRPVLSEKPDNQKLTKSFPFGLQSQNQKPNRKKEREREEKERKKETYVNEETLRTSAAQVAIFQFVRAVQNELSVQSPSDISTLRNIAYYLYSKRNENEDILKEAQHIATESKTARKPIAVFCKRIKTEYQWIPRKAITC
jgi:hypothetical protein